MARIALIFPGQGAQFVGMGADYYEGNAASRAVFDRLEALSLGLKDLCFNSSKEDLALTINTQPCIFATQMAIHAAITETGLRPSFFAGFSLGEVSALCAAGCLSLEQGFKLVSLRAALMQEASLAHDTAMLVSLKLDAQRVEAICAEFESAYPVNYNAPEQTVIACASSELEAVKEAIKAAGGRSLQLSVQAGFHSPFMDEAAAAFKQELTHFDFHAPTATLYSNFSAKPYGENFIELLSAQINHPVRWTDLVANMKADGVEVLIELGPGQVLSGLVAKIDPDLTCTSVSSYTDFETYFKEHHA